MGTDLRIVYKAKKELWDAVSLYAFTSLQIMAKSATKGESKKKKNYKDQEISATFCFSELEIDVAHLLIQLGGASGTKDLSLHTEEEKSDAKTRVNDQVSCAFKYRLVEEEEENEKVSFRPICKKRFRSISDLYKWTKPPNNVIVVNKWKNMYYTA